MYTGSEFAAYRKPAIPPHARTLARRALAPRRVTEGGTPSWPAWQSPRSTRRRARSPSPWTKGGWGGGENCNCGAGQGRKGVDEHQGLYLSRPLQPKRALTSTRSAEPCCRRSPALSAHPVPQRRASFQDGQTPRPPVPPLTRRAPRAGPRTPLVPAIDAPAPPPLPKPTHSSIGFA